MKLILLSGGSGTRLWPLSDDTLSKQFLKVLKNQDGDYESMLQRTVRQIKSVQLLDNTYIATTQPQAELIESQLDDKLPTIIEPDRRDTFPAIALSSAYLHHEQGVGLDEIICICPVDLYVEDTFFHALKKIEQALNIHSYDLAMIGIHPTYPAEKYGYIVPIAENDSSQTVLKVKRFVEKPSEEQATRLITERALWNSGVFCFKLRFLMDLLTKRNLPLTYHELLENYKQLPKISFDYEVAEKSSSTAVLVYNGLWNDMGTWDALVEKIDNPITGKGKLSENSHNTHIINKLNIPVLVVGISDAVIVVSEKGILVSDKSNSARLKDFI